MSAVDGRSERGFLERVGLTALGYPPFVTFLSANLVSNASWFVYAAALNTYILAVTGSAAEVGFASFVYSLPGALFMLHAGLLTDRFGARRLVAISLVGSGIPILLIGVLALQGASIPLLIGLGFVMGVFQTLGSPAFISIVNDLVPPRAVSSAVALTFLGFNVGRILGGVLTGILLVALGADVLVAAPMAIVIAGILQVLPAIPVAAIHVNERVARTTGREMVRPLMETAAYVTRNPTLAVIVLLAIGPGAIGLVYMYLLPVVVRDLGAEPSAIGLLYIGGGMGGLIAGLVAEPVMRAVGHGRAMFVGIATIGIGLIATGAAGAVPLTAAAVGLTQAGFALYASSALSLVQALSPARLRGRVTSLFTLLYWGLMPFGALVAGFIAERLTSLTTLMLNGAVILVMGAVALVGRRQIVTLRIERDGHSVAGDLRGSGYVPEIAT
jgi:MFS family permease